jgi:hypothetical protein
VFLGIHFQLDQRLRSRLDANLYEERETVQLAIPMTLPYPIHSNGFERVNGRFEHKGEFFRLIKHKLRNDTLYVVCIRDHETRRLLSTFKNIVHDTLGLTNTNKKALNFLSKLIKDFFPDGEVEVVHLNGFTAKLTFAEGSEHFKQPILTVHAPPPRG